jgi:hypothetical protein
MIVQSSNYLCFFSSIEEECRHYFVCTSDEVSVICVDIETSLPSFLVEQRAFKEHDFKELALQNVQSPDLLFSLPDRYSKKSSD